MPPDYADLTAWIEALFDTVERDMDTCRAPEKDCPADESGDAENAGNTEQDRAVNEGDD